MGAVAFDTHKYVKSLVSAGMPEPQAEIIADKQAELVTEQLATKADVTDIRRDMKQMEARLQGEIVTVKRDMKEMEAGLRRDMKQMETGLKRDMKEMETRLEHRLTLRLGSMMVVAVGVVAALVKLL